MADKPSIWWIRRDLRLTDNPALVAALKAGDVIPLFILDERFETLGAAPRWRLQEGLRKLGKALEDKGARLILRRGDALQVLRDVISETKAGAVHWMRLYDPFSRGADAKIKAALRDEGCAAESHAGHLLQEPMGLQTQSGGFYKVFSPFWKQIRQMDVPRPLAAPERLPAVDAALASDRLESWELGADMQRGARVVARYERVGEAEALAQLEAFFDGPVSRYDSARNALAEEGCSRLSAHLSLGEISPRVIWDWAMRARAAGTQGLEPYLRQIGWRDFAHHLMYHTPHMLEENWREGWEEFPWREDAGSAALEAWRYGRTGIDLVDAAMRELWVTGRMHNRARMIAASYLTKHLMVHWRLGERWFADQLVDYDPACNAMGWQWVAGTGPDASPFFRIFNPETQQKNFDPKGDYLARWLAEGQGDPPKSALGFYEAIPLSAGLSPQDARPKEPIVGLAEGRERALAAYEAMRG